MSPETSSKPAQPFSDEQLPGLPPQESSVVPESPFAGLDDIVAVDNRNRGHRPDGKFLSTHEMTQIAEHGQLIREALGARATEGAEITWSDGGENVHHESHEPFCSSDGSTEQLPNDILGAAGNERYDHADSNDAEAVRAVASEAMALTEPVPALQANETDQGRMAKAKAFFGRRLQQFKHVGTRIDKTLDTLFNREVTPGLTLTGRDALKARLHPTQLGHNVVNNVRAVRGTSKKYQDIHNPVVRDTLYRLVAEDSSRGDDQPNPTDPDALRRHEIAEQAKTYLFFNDHKLGETSYGPRDAAHELALIFSGTLALRRLGLMAVAGVNIGKKLITTDVNKAELYASRAERAGEQLDSDILDRSYNERTKLYKQVASSVRPGYRPAVHSRHAH